MQLHARAPGNRRSGAGLPPAPSRRPGRHSRSASPAASESPAVRRPRMHHHPAPRRFRAPPQRIAWRKGEIGIGGGAAGGQQNQPAREHCPPEPRPGLVASVSACWTDSPSRPGGNCGRDSRNPQGSMISTRHAQAGPEPHQATRHFAECRAHKAPGAPKPPSFRRRSLSTRQKRHFLRHRAARPSKIDFLFYRAPMNKLVRGSARHRVSTAAALVCGKSSSTFLSVVLKGDPVAATTVTRARDAIFFMWRRARLARWALAAMAWPFIDQMNPSAAALALASIEVDLAPVRRASRSS